MWQYSVLWCCQCLYQYSSALFCVTLIVCTNVAVLCFVILSVPLSIWQCFFVWYCDCLYECGSAMLCDTQCLYQCGISLFCGTVIACTNLEVLYFLIIKMPVPMWLCSFLWYSQCLYQCDSTLLCDTVSACADVTMPFFMIFSMRVQYGSALFCDTVISSTNVAVLCCVILTLPLPLW